MIINSYLQKIPAKELSAGAFRAVAKLAENVLISNKGGPKPQKSLNFGTILLTFSRNCGEKGGEAVPPVAIGATALAFTKMNSCTCINQTF